MNSAKEAEVGAEESVDIGDDWSGALEQPSLPQLETIESKTGEFSLGSQHGKFGEVLLEEWLKKLLQFSKEWSIIL